MGFNSAIKGLKY